VQDRPAAIEEATRSEGQLKSMGKPDNNTNKDTAKSAKKAAKGKKKK